MIPMMQAAFLAGPRSFEVRPRPVPVPTAGTVLVKLARAGICGGDLQQYRNVTAALPVTPGHEGCGTVAEAPGQETLTGQRVVFDPQVHWCGRCTSCAKGQTELCAQRRYLGAHVDGTFAQYVIVPQDRLYPIPDSMTWGEAASVHGLAGPVFAVQRIAQEIGETAVVLGPGAAGLLFVQLQKRCLGAGKVILAGRSAPRLALGLQLGADAVINTRDEDLISGVMELTGGRGADIIIETTGDVQIRHSLPALAAPRARVLSYAVGPIGFDSLKSMSVFGSTGATRSMRPAIDLIASGRVRTDVLASHAFPLRDIQAAFELAIRDGKDNYVKGLIAFDAP